MHTIRDAVLVLVTNTRICPRSTQRIASEVTQPSYNTQSYQRLSGYPHDFNLGASLVWQVRSLAFGKRDVTWIRWVTIFHSHYFDNEWYCCGHRYWDGYNGLLLKFIHVSPTALQKTCGNIQLNTPLEIEIWFFISKLHSKGYFRQFMVDLLLLFSHIVRLQALFGSSCILI